MEQTYNIPVQSVNEVRKRLVKLQKRAEKLGLKPFTFQFGQDTKVYKFETDTADGDHLVGRYNYLELTVSQDITVHEGWVPIAKLDIGMKEIKSYAVYNSELEKIGEERMWSKKCDHCGHKKIVHTAFILQNGNEFMKVGSGCMKELAPAAAVNIAREFDIYSLWSSYLNAMADAMKDGMSSGRGGFGGGVQVDKVYDKSQLILALRIALERTNGEWVTSQYSNDERNPTVINKGSRTFDFVANAFDTRWSFIPDAEYVKSINDQIATVLEKYPTSVSEEKLIEIKTFHEASRARIIDVFIIKTVQAIIAREERNKLNGHFFIDGQKVELEIKEIASHGYQGGFGWVSIKTYLTKDGQIVKYVGSSPIEFKIQESKKEKELYKAVWTMHNSYPQGEEAWKAHHAKVVELDEQLEIEQKKRKNTPLPEYWRVKGTVKHTEYKGVKETHLQRMKLI